MTHFFEYWHGSTKKLMVNNLPAVQETWVWSLGQEDPLEKKLATHSSILVWRIPWTEEPGRLQSTGSQRVRHDGATHTLTFHGHTPYTGGSQIWTRAIWHYTACPLGCATLALWKGKGQNWTQMQGACSLHSPVSCPPRTSHLWVNN